MRFLLTILCAGVCACSVWAGSSNSLMDITPDGSLLLIANRDNGTVTVIDVPQRKVLREIVVGEHPEGVCWIGKGPTALVTIYEEDRVVLIDARQKNPVASIKVLNEPYGIVATRDGSKAYVTHDYPGMVSEIDLQKRAVERTFKAGNWSRGLAIDNDEKMLYITDFYTSTLTAVTIQTGTITDSWPGHPTQNLCRNVVLHPKRGKAYLPHIVSRVTVAEGRGSIFPEISMCDLRPIKGEDDRRRRSIALDTYNGVYVTANTWEVAVTPDGKKIFKVYAGTNDVNVSTIIDDDYREMDRIRLPFKVGANPRAIRIHPHGHELYIYNTLDFTVGVYDVESLRKLASIEACKPPHTPEWVRGKVLFQSALLSGAKWISCSSCHPDGLTDGRTWHNPEGLRRTPPLLGLADTHPLHWSADRDEVQDFEYTIRGRLMAGRGLITGSIKPKVGFHPIELEEKTSGRSKDLDALAIYTNSFKFRLSPHIPEPGKLTASAERGKAIFFDTRVGCATCHTGPLFTDSRLQKPFNVHNVGTGDDPLEKMGPAYDTPTLLGVYRNRSYLHHGKAESLLAVITTFNAKDQHGKTSHLGEAQKLDLVAFLKSLPYEVPPAQTPNSVPYRLKPNASPRVRRRRLSGELAVKPSQKPD